MLLGKVYDFVFGILPIIFFYVIVFSAIFSLMFFIGGIAKLPSTLFSIFLTGLASWFVADIR